MSRVICGDADGFTSAANEQRVAARAEDGRGEPTPEAEHPPSMAADFIEGRHPPNRPGPNGLAEVLLHGEGDDDARASYVVIHTPIADHLEYASER